jgi:hypothetical protein
MTRPAVQQFAGHYLNLGFDVVPLLARLKKCVDDDWPQKTYGVEHFSAHANIGLRSLNGLVVLDDDFETSSLECDTAFLSPTGAIWGRPAKPRSKRLYHCPELTETITFTDIDSTHLYQLRVGLQDMAPPSIHPDTGERLKWSGLLLPPQEISKEVLVGRARYRWTVGLLAKYWPARGRHDLRLAYARVLLETLKIHPDDATRILEWVCRLGGSDAQGIRDGARAIADTRERLAAGEKAFGAPKIAELLPQTGRQIVRLLRKAYGKTDAMEEAIEELNEHNAIVWQQSGSMVILTEDTEDGHPHLRFSKPSDMALLYPELIQVGTKKNDSPILKPRGSVWLTHPQRRFYRGIEVAPNGRGNAGYYNMWRGFSVEPQKGEWPLFREHLDLVANHNPDYARYILAWMAETVQHPERPIGVALAFKGKQGTGKSTFAKWFGALFGVHFLHLDSEQHLLGRFNAHLHNAIVLLADEAVWAGSKAGLGALKRMITEDTLNIERKNVDILTVKNMLHMLVASNEKWVVPAGFDNRRFAIFGTSVKRIKDKKFFLAVHRELKQGGFAAVLYDLLDHKSDIDLEQIPETDDLREQKGLSADMEETWWLEKLHQGQLVAPGRDEDGTTESAWPHAGRVPKDVIHADYLQFLEKHRRGGRNPHATETELGRFLKKRTPLDDNRTMFNGERLRLWDVPSLDECRAAWAFACGWPEDFPWGE